MSDLITYDDKIRLKSQNVSEKYKVTARDMNEIKSVVNNNAEEIDEINKPENWVSVGTTAPTDGRRVWFENSRNILIPNFTNGYTNTKTGITLTYNNGTYRVQGTATSDYFFTIADQNQKDLRAKLLSGKYYLSGAPSGSSNSTYFLQIYGISATGTSVVRTFEEGLRINNFVNEAQNFNISIFVKANQTIDVLFKPQLEEGEKTSFEPYIEPSINVDGDEIYNLKLQTPQKITLSFNTTYVYSTDLDYICFKLGNLVFLFINILAFKVGTIADFPNFSVIISGLPRPAQNRFFYLQPSGKSDNKFRASITTEGNMKRHWSADPVYGDTQNKQYSGCIVYETID